MTEHLSTWSLDRLAAGEGLDTRRRQHLDGCDACRQQVEAHAAALETARAAPQLRQIRARAIAALPEPATRRWWPALGLAAAAAAVATLAVLALRPAPPADGPIRTKGAATLALTGIGDGAVRDAWPVGAEVELRVHAEPAYVLVLAVDAAGEASVAWPGAAQSGPRPVDGRLAPGFRVTPGDLTLMALFSAEPLDAAAARDALAAAVARCADPLDRACLERDAPEADARAWYRLKVDARGDRP